MSPRSAPRERWTEFDAVRARAVATASGTVLEIGAGTGGNFTDFAPGITWIGLEPHAPSRATLTQKARARGHRRDVLAARSERIPLEARSVDSVVGTFVMCSVDDVAATLAECRRVLAPGGRLVLVDHLAAAPGTGTRRLQNLITPLSRRIDKGCRYNREITDEITTAGFSEVTADWHRVAVFPGVAIPCAVHTARA